MAGKGLDRRYPETVLEPLGSNSGVHRGGGGLMLSSIGYRAEYILERYPYGIMPVASASTEKLCL